MRDQAYPSRQHFRFEDIRHRDIHEESAAFAKRFEHEVLHFLCFCSTGPRAFDRVLCQFVHRTMKRAFVRKKKTNFRDWDEELGKIRRHRQDQSHFLSAALRKKGAVAFVRHQAELNADGVKRQVQWNVFRLEHAETFLRLRRAILRRVL